MRKWEEGCLRRFKDMLVIPSRTSSVKREENVSSVLGPYGNSPSPQEGRMLPEGGPTLTDSALLQGSALTQATPFQVSFYLY